MAKLTAKERLDNLYRALMECDSDCASKKGKECSCGAEEFAKLVKAEKQKKKWTQRS